MDGGMDAEQRPGGAVAQLLTQAELAGDRIRSAAAADAAEVLAAAGGEVERLLALAARQAEEVVAAATARGDGMRARAADSAEAEQSAVGRRCREAVLAAVTEGERLRAEAHDQGRRITLEAECRADDLLASARRQVVEIDLSARRSADELPAEAARHAAEQLAEVREAFGRASAARAVAEQQAARVREEAARTAAAGAEEARRTLEVARRARAIARRDAGQVVARAMAEAARALQEAAMQYDVAKELLAQEAEVAREEGPFSGLGGVAVAVETAPVHSDSAVAVPPVVTAPVAVQPAASEPAASEPVASEPVVTESLGVEPVAEHPVAVQTLAVEPFMVQSLAVRTITLEPVLRPGVEPEVEPDVEPDVEHDVEPEDQEAFAPLLVPVLSFGRELVLRLLVFGAAITTAWFWLWWLSTGYGEWTFGSVTASLLLAWVFLLSGYFFFFICRMSKPNKALPVPDLRVAMVVTKAPSEAWPVLMKTIEAMQAQEFDRSYDIWLADERPSLETLQWCLAHDVKVSTRYGVHEYHRPTWPRRTKSKEGNLAYFYDTVGYDRYDVVVQLDADHVPTPTYLEEMVRPFRHPGIGYVCAPSICDANMEEGWTVRGRLYREGSMHGPVQAGCNGGYAPVCIGSHYAVRTAALRDIGGIGPDLAEDYSTTLFFQSRGWDGVFSIDAVAHGDGPATVEEMLVQEVQWARSLGTVLMRWAPGRLRTVPWRARPRLAFALVFYPVSGLVVALAAAAPVAGVVTRTSWGNTSLAGFYIHLWPHTIVSMAVVIFLRRCMLLRPVEAKVWSWELLLFQLVRWPWTLWGFLQGAYAGMRSKVINFGVTPKSVPGARALPPKYVVPTLVLGGLPAWIVVWTSDVGPAAGLMVLAALQALLYMGCAALVVVLHLWGNRRRNRAANAPPPDARLSRWDAGLTAAALTACVVAPTVVGLMWRLSTL